MNSSAILDIDAHLGSLATDENVAMMLNALLRASEQDMARLRAAMAGGDIEEAGRSAHALAGGALAAGAPALARAAGEFERAAKGGIMPDVAALESVCEATREAARQRLNR